MDHDPTRPEHTFDPQQIKCLPAFDPTRRDFFLPKWKKFDVFRGDFPNPNLRWLT